MLLFQNFFLAIVGIALLIWGAEKFVFYSSNLAKRFGISDLLIGLTLIAFGTSAPEIFIGISSIFNDAGEIPIGTIIGSNISFIFDSYNSLFSSNNDLLSFRAMTIFCELFSMKMYGFSSEIRLVELRRITDKNNNFLKVCNIVLL